METPSEHSTYSSGDESQKSDTMARRNTAKSFPPKRPELDLSAMLSPEQAKQLQVLVASILDDMQRKIRDTFDHLNPTRDESDGGIRIKLPKAAVMNIPNPRSEKYRYLYGDIGLPVEKPDLEDREALKEILKPKILPANDTHTSKPTLILPKSPEETTILSRKNENEIVVSSMSELKRDVLGHFGKWRLVVLRRVGDIVIKNGGTGGNVVRQEPQQAPGNARRTGTAGRGRPARPPGPNPSIEDSNTGHIRRYPEMFTLLRNCAKEKRALILHSILLLILGGDQYSSYARIFLLKLSTSLHIPPFVLLQDEGRVSRALAQIIKGIPHEEIAQRRAEEGKPPKRWRSTAVAGTTPIPVNNVLAEPLVNAGLGTVFGGIGLAPTTTANLLGAIGSSESTVPVGTLFGLYGARQGGKMMDAYAKDVQDFAMIPMHGSLGSEFIDPKDVPAEDRRMRVTIGIGGWITQDKDFRHPWQVLGDQTEVYALRWEVEAMMKMGAALGTVVKNAAWSATKRDMVDCNLSTSLQESRWPTHLLKISKVVDNPWTIGMVRAEKAGLVLAEILMNKIQGERAVTLVGYSLGARIIYSCLMSLAEKRAFGIVENVVMMGAPCPSDIHAWATMKSVVPGRLVNVWSETDYLLGFLYRNCAWHYGVAGLQPVTGVPMVENVDLSNIIVNHLRYQYSVGKILKNLNWEDIDYSVVDSQMDMLVQMAREEEKLDSDRHITTPWQEKEAENLFFKRAQDQGQRHVAAGQAMTQRNTGRPRLNGKENRHVGQETRS
ncbi:hypothetical protein F5X99DRAFT_421387 [Biscogniauxia marginata]|nr:hypothetical protein F5X99DRAFT_421387 [Biscogniauxia marginata]